VFGVPAISALLALTSTTVRSAPDPVWVWNVRCGASALIIELRLDAHSIHQVVVPICRQQGLEQSRVVDGRRVSFSFTPDRAIDWHGYRDREDVAPAGSALAIELWQAAADANNLMLGVVALNPASGEIYMKTVHIAKVDKDSATDIARGLTLSSRPYREGSR
jgi:hypothetical protein